MIKRIVSYCTPLLEEDMIALKELTGKDNAKDALAAAVAVCLGREDWDGKE